ncbi:MAG: tetratricopeptide repeat protein [Alphaproteobacteria bacterium]|nr:tetratricopeptide repeat protein [Alphaproteobacteria bacterium]
MRDAQGLEVSTDNPETVAAIDLFRDEFLGYGNRILEILEAPKSDPGCALVNAQAACLYMFFETGESPDLARPNIEAAKATASSATPREQAYVAAIDAWVSGDVERAIAGHYDIAERWPRDVFAMKLCQYHHFNLGQVKGMLRIVEAVLEANAENHFVHGCHTFALEQNHRLAEAEAAGRRAVGMTRQDPWAHHAVAHVMDTQGRLDEGIAWLEAHADTWEDCNSFMLSHNWWHLALFHLDRDDPAKALDLYDRRIWGVDKSYSQDQVGAASMLWRLELRGADVGDRWADVADHVADRTREHVQPFLDIQYLYALARAGRTEAVSEMLESMATHAGAAAPPRRPMLNQVALPLARGFAAAAAGNHRGAYRQLEPAVPRLQEIGGSHAQRDLFQQAWIDVLVKGGESAQAADLLRRRAAARKIVPATFRDLAEALDTIGDGAGAAEARAYAEDLGRRYAGESL